MRRNRLQTPRASGSIVSDPPLHQVTRLARDNFKALSTCQLPILGTPLRQVRNQVRREVLEFVSSEAKLDAPVIMSGHQPELFHPGVWIKNFAINWAARHCEGNPLHMRVDNDTAKATSVRVPSGSRKSPTAVRLQYDRWDREIPFEELEVQDESVFASIGDRVAEHVSPLGWDPILTQVWRQFADVARERNLGDRLSALRQVAEARFGNVNPEINCSRICQTGGFKQFACHVFVNSAAFRESYNRELFRFRRRERIRSKHHPVPELSREDDWYEVPFWVWRSDDPVRRKLFARPLTQGCELTDRRSWTETIRLDADSGLERAASELDRITGTSVKLRTRALTTTLFCRLFLCDLFVHGLGGARYDELCDGIIADFVGLKPPGFMTLTGTLLPPGDWDDQLESRQAAVGRLLRDVAYNPQRHIDLSESSPDLVGQVQRRWELAHLSPRNRRERRGRFSQIRKLNEQLAPALIDRTRQLREQLKRLDLELAAREALARRDWPFVVYAADDLSAFFKPFLPPGSQ